LQADSFDEDTYLASLQIKTRIERVAIDAKLDRIEELFRRTTQFNATGRLFAVPELQQLATSSDVSLFSLHVSDRFADHGLVGAAVIEGNEITGLVMSCRVLGMGIEHEFVRQIVKACSADQVVARIVPTSRNIPVRNIYRDNGFVLDDDGVWRWNVPARASAEAAG
jgi:FkbH-like protein